jgi:hypothetical protein
VVSNANHQPVWFRLLVWLQKSIADRLMVRVAHHKSLSYWWRFSIANGVGNLPSSNGMEATQWPRKIDYEMQR